MCITNIKKRHISSEISRRNFLKQSLFGLAGLALPWKSRVTVSQLENFQGVKTALGRVLKPEITVFSAPNFSSRSIGRIRINSILNILQTVKGQTDPHSNSLWYQIASRLYIHSSGVQQVENRINPIIDQIPSRGKLAQITVPIIEAWKNSFSKQDTFIPLYYGSTHWVTAFAQDDLGNSFYKIAEDRWGEIYFVKAECLQLFSNEELTPISSSIPAAEKRIEVHLKDQMVVAYENDLPVFNSPMSSGLLDPTKDFFTPPGDYEIIYKRPSRHMTHNDRIGFVDTDLYGVPWVCYFTDTGIAFHGTYWHNEFTYPHSHGCINLPIEAAKWIYLWSQPIIPTTERTYVSNHGTAVKVS
jgi:lipoprotein-anchoring transpeptidase ErfK/SrfK